MAALNSLMNLAVMSLLLIKLAMAANYTVGAPNGGWDTATNLQTWAKTRSFLVGDNLIFQYTTNHDVLEVSQSDYDSCQTGNPLQTYLGGTTIIPLSAPGKRYFICGTSGHCVGGMKVEIDILATSAQPPASPSTPPPTSPSAPPPASPTNPPPPQTSTPSPAQPPESTPTLTPPSPPSSRSSSPAPSPSTFPPPSVSDLLPPPSPSSNKGSSQTSFTVGFTLALMMLFLAV